MPKRHTEEDTPGADTIDEAFRFAGLPPRKKPEENTIRFDSDELGVSRGFTQLPNIVLKDSRLAHADVRLYALLLSYAWAKGQCYPGQERLASDMGCDSTVTITRTMAHLVKVKLIRVKRRGQGKVNIYYIRKIGDAYGKPIVDKGAGG